jgi:hypothetical protein
LGRQQAVQLGYAGIATEAGLLRARLTRRNDRPSPHLELSEIQ